MTKVLICGGRDWTDAKSTFRALDELHEARKFSLVITGGARGADRLGYEWARRRGIPADTYKAEWKKHGGKAGPIRNQQMLDEAKPDVVVAFPGGTGTADMVRRARADSRVMSVLEIDPRMRAGSDDHLRARARRSIADIDAAVDDLNAALTSLTSKR